MRIEQSKLDQIDPDVQPGYLLPDASPDALALMRRPVFERLAGLAEPSGLAAKAAKIHGVGCIGADDAAIRGTGQSSAMMTISGMVCGLLSRPFVRLHVPCSTGRL